MIKRNLFLFITLIVVTIAYYARFSFSIPILNTVAFVCALASFIVLSKLLATDKAKFYINFIFAFGWVYTFLFGLFLLLDLIDHRKPDLQNGNQAEFCTRSGYGFVGTDGGIEMRAYKRFWIFDKEVGNYRISDMYDSPKDTMGVYEFCKDKKIIELR